MDEKTEIPTSMADNEMLKHFAQEAEVRLSYIIRKRNFYFFFSHIFYQPLRFSGQGRLRAGCKVLQRGNREAL